MADSKDNWQLNLSIAQCNKHMLQNKLACDVIFKVGEEKKEIGAHKYVLASRSPVFFAMFFGPNASFTEEEEAIKVTDIQSDAFEDMLFYLYTDDISLHEENVFSVLYASKKYMLPGLASYCGMFLAGEMNSNNVAHFYENLLVYDDQELVKAFELYICENFNEVSQSSEFLELKQSTIEKILSLDRLSAQEEDVYQAALSWAKAECVRKKIVCDGPGLRQVLGPAFCQIRFPTMNIMEFTQSVLPFKGILTAEEEHALFRIITGKEFLSHFISNDPVLPYPSTPRQPDIVTVYLHDLFSAVSTVKQNVCQIEMTLGSTKTIRLKTIDTSILPSGMFNSLAINSSSSGTKEFSNGPLFQLDEFIIQPFTKYWLSMTSHSYVNLRVKQVTEEEIQKAQMSGVFKFGQPKNQQAFGSKFGSIQEGLMVQSASKDLTISGLVPNFTVMYAK